MEIRKDLFLGPNSWPRWIKQLFPYKYLFNSAALQHDKGYAKLKTIIMDKKTKKELRAKIDYFFFEDMEEAINNSNRGYFYKLGARIMSRIYYFSVRCCGWYFVRKKDENN